MQIYPGLPPYTDTSGRGTIRIGRACEPLTGTLRRRIMLETGETDFTSLEVPDNPAMHLSAAIEQLRDAAERERAPEELLKLNDLDLLSALGVLRNGCLTRAGLLLAGKESSIRAHLPGYVWTHLRMRSDTDYSDRMDGRDAMPVALARLTDRIMADNPITTVHYGLFHFEYRTYPEIALREALMNALRPDLHRRLLAPGHPDRDRRTDWEAAKTRVLSILRGRFQRGESGMTNAEVRSITRLDRKQVNRLMHELQEEGEARIDGYGRGARYVFSNTKRSE